MKWCNTTGRGGKYSRIEVCMPYLNYSDLIPSTPNIILDKTIWGSILQEPVKGEQKFIMQVNKREKGNAGRGKEGSLWAKA